MQFHLVEFADPTLDNIVTVVPDAWTYMDQGAHLCFWPNNGQSWSRSPLQQSPELSGSSSCSNQPCGSPAPGPSGDSPRRQASRTYYTASSRRFRLARPLPRSASRSSPVATHRRLQSSEMKELKNWSRTQFERVFKGMEDLSNGIKRLERKMDAVAEREMAVHNFRGPATLPEGFSFPIGDLEVLKELENVLRESADTRDALVAYLATFGGSEPRRSMRLIGRELLRARLSLQFNLTGNKGKKSMDASLPIFRNVMFEAMKRIHVTLTRDQFRKVLARWLSGSIDRDGMKQEREGCKRRRLAPQ